MTMKQPATETEHDQLSTLGSLLDAYQIQAQMRADDPGLTPWLHIQHGGFATYAYILDGYFCAFHGMRIGRITDPDGVARQIAYLYGVRSMPACF